MTALGDTMKNPYTPDEIFNLINQSEEGNHDYVSMDPKRVQVTLEAEALRGFDKGFNYAEEIFRRQKIAIAIIAAMVIAIQLFAIIAGVIDSPKYPPAALMQ